MKIGIINLGINNIKSVKDFFSLFGNTYILHHADDFELDTKIIILPGNGSFGAGVENLKNKEFDALLNDLREKKILIIGICLGMQLFFESSDENSRVKGLNFFDGKVKKIISKNCRLPLLGWYEVSSIQKEINCLKLKDVLTNFELYYDKPDSTNTILKKIDMSKIDFV